jgi:hypothetical protein
MNDPFQNSKYPLISHEVPISLLYQSRFFNDYDYCLSHLMRDNSFYRNYFYDSLKKDREIIIDNSIYEGKNLEDETYQQIIMNLCLQSNNSLSQITYIIPDVWSDKDNTLENFYKWQKETEKNKIPAKKMCVVQGKTLSEMYECFEEMVSCEDIDYIGIPFASKAYEASDITERLSLNPKKVTLWEKWSWGRTQFLFHIRNHEIFKLKKEPFIHLLGCSLPSEFIRYFVLHDIYKLTDISLFIRSLDTSNPIIQGYLGREYQSVYSSSIYPSMPGVDSKDSIKIDDIIYEKVVLTEKMFLNIQHFRTFCGKKPLRAEEWVNFKNFFPLFEEEDLKNSLTFF